MKELNQMFLLDNDAKSDDESEENCYEEIFDQILGGLKRPKLNSLWEHSVPNSPNPGSPFGSLNSLRLESTQNSPNQRPKAPTPEHPKVPKVFTGIRRCDSDDYGLRSSPSSPKGESRLKSSIRFSERRFSDVTVPFSPGYESVMQVRKRFNYKGPPNAPPSPTPQKAAKGHTKPLMVARGYEQQISPTDDDVFPSNSETHKVFFSL